MWVCCVGDETGRFLIAVIAGRVDDVVAADPFGFAVAFAQVMPVRSAELSFGPVSDWHGSLFRVDFLSRKLLSPKPGALSHPFSTPTHSSLRWIGAKYRNFLFRVDLTGSDFAVLCWKSQSGEPKRSGKSMPDVRE